MAIVHAEKICIPCNPRATGPGSGNKRNSSRMNPKASPSSRVVLVSLLLLTAAAPPAMGQLFQNLQSLTRTIPVGSGITDADGKRLDGPRWICSGDFDHDSHADLAVCHLDGTITLLYGNGGGVFTPQTLVSGALSLRAMVAEDFNGDGRDDLAAASPYDAKVAVLLAGPGRTWAAPRHLSSFSNARNLAAGDFDGDSVMDLAVAGPDESVAPPGGAGHTWSGALSRHGRRRLRACGGCADGGSGTR